MNENGENHGGKRTRAQVAGLAFLFVAMAAATVGVLLYRSHRQDLATKADLQARLASDDQAICAPLPTRSKVALGLGATRLPPPAAADLATALGHVRDALKALPFPCAYHAKLVVEPDVDSGRCQAMLATLAPDLEAMHAALHADTPDLAGAICFETARIRKGEVEARSTYQLFGAEMVQAGRRNDNARAHALAIDSLVLARDLLDVGDLTDVLSTTVLIDNAMYILQSPKAVPTELLGPLPSIDAIFTRDRHETRTLAFGAYASPSCPLARELASLAQEVPPGYFEQAEVMKAYRSYDERIPSAEAEQREKYEKAYADTVKPMGLVPPP